MKIDREIQKKLLEELERGYPSFLTKYNKRYLPTDLMVDFHYLTEHGLVEWAQVASSTQMAPKITAAGIDFLADDGGLSAILGVVTVKLHDDTVRQLIEARIQTAEIPETTKSHLLKSLREAPGETIKLLTEKLLDASLSSWPAAIAVIQKIL